MEITKLNNVMIDNYEIKDGYNHRQYECYLDVTNGKDEAQDKVYFVACEIVKKYNLNTIADVGCGSGFKLLKYFSEYKTIGYDLKKTIDKLRTKNKLSDTHIWEYSDFSQNPHKTDIVVCADVIEHVLYPNNLIEYILKMDPKYVVISTPDRDSLAAEGRLQGPPQNVHHIREWSLSEFSKYMSRWFNIVSSENVSQCGYEYILMVLSKK